MTAMLTAEETAGAAGLTRLRAAPGERGPRHIHAREDELFVVLGGRLRVFAGERTRLLDAGGLAFLPRGIPHGYEVIGAGADVLIITMPGGFERFFLEGGYPVARDGESRVGARWSVSRTKRIAEELGLGLTWLD
jgi:quercetin dioxygenase-like cupin family protein